MEATTGPVWIKGFLREVRYRQMHSACFHRPGDRVLHSMVNFAGRQVCENAPDSRFGNFEPSHTQPFDRVGHHNARGLERLFAGRREDLELAKPRAKGGRHLARIVRRRNEGR